MIKNELSKCPFCGGSAGVIYDVVGNFAYVECNECHARSRIAKVNKGAKVKLSIKEDCPTMQTAEEAVAFVMGAWERRPND